MQVTEAQELELFKQAAKRDSLQDLQAREMAMWNEWKASGEDPDKLRPLIKSFKPLIKNRVNLYANKVPIPNAAIEAEVNKQFLDAVRTYDPNRIGRNTGKAASLNTHIYGRLRKAGRFIKKYQNVGTIPEKRIDQITPFKVARGELQDGLGREPSVSELASHLKWSPAEVTRMETELRKDLLASEFDYRPETGDPTFLMPSRDREIIQLIKYELTPREQLVLEYKLGMGGKPRLGTAEIAKKLGVSSPTVSRVVTKIQKLVESYGGGF